MASYGPGGSSIIHLQSRGRQQVFCRRKLGERSTFLAAVSRGARSRLHQE